MARVKTARITRKKHKKVLKQAKGYFGAKRYRFRNANQAVLKSLSYAYGQISHLKPLNPHIIRLSSILDLNMHISEFFPHAAVITIFN